MLKPSRLKAGLDTQGMANQSSGNHPQGNQTPASHASGNPSHASGNQGPLTRGGRAGALPLVERVSTPQHFVPPTPRERRSQAVQRLQVGLFGLAAMLLLVGLANIIMQHARLADAASGIPVSAKLSSTGAAGNTDPLADIGVAPSPDAAISQHHTSRSANH